jgi:uncharacterized protein (DUF2235 family)
MPKNIVIFSDGTGQDGGVRAEQRMSNIYKLYRACRVAPDTTIDPREQVAFYDPGLGTETTATGVTGAWRHVQKLTASVAGRGITDNIADCYEFIINHYEPGDRIFLFGFSRGAYTVRNVANLIMLCGIPTRLGNAPLPRFRKANRDIAEEALLTVLEHGAGHPRGKYEDERLELARRFREKYGSHRPTSEVDRSNVAPYFVGVFDTVAALGAKGARRFGIKTLLIGGSAALGAAIAAIAALIIAVIEYAVSDSWSWRLVFALIGIGALIGAVAQLRKQRRSIYKSIRDFPNKGDYSGHFAEWKGENFDRLLSRFVSFARSANAIDETRIDFARVPWGHTIGAPYQIGGHICFKQWWFAGNHSDIGGSYAEAESRLSDIALKWMIEEATEIPDGLKIGPAFANGVKIPNTGNSGPSLHLFPAAGGMQHCEVTATSDWLDAMLPAWLRPYTESINWKVQIREIDPKAMVHPTVAERFALVEVTQCAGSGPYRPEALRTHQTFRGYYEPK